MESAEVAGSRMGPTTEAIARDQGEPGEDAEAGRGSGEVNDDGDVVGGALALALVAVDGGAGDAARQGR